jgi:hypothetical protein
MSHSLVTVTEETWYGGKSLGGSQLETTPRPGRLRLKCDGTRAETDFRLSAKRTSPFESAGASVQSTTGSRGVLSEVVMLDTPRSEVV